MKATYRRPIIDACGWWSHDGEAIELEGDIVEDEHGFVVVFTPASQALVDALSDDEKTGAIEAMFAAMDEDIRRERVAQQLGDQAFFDAREAARRTAAE